VYISLQSVWAVNTRNAPSMLMLKIIDKKHTIQQKHFLITAVFSYYNYRHCIITDSLLLCAQFISTSKGSEYYNCCNNTNMFISKIPYTIDHLIVYTYFVLWTFYNIIIAVTDHYPLSLTWSSFTWVLKCVFW